MLNDPSPFALGRLWGRRVRLWGQGVPWRSARLGVGAASGGRLGGALGSVTAGRLWAQTEFQVNLKLGLTPRADPARPGVNPAPEVPSGPDYPCIDNRQEANDEQVVASGPAARYHDTLGLTRNRLRGKPGVSRRLEVR